jgi:6-phosphogluconolactonase (cycloisomerase 2 family)
MKKINFLKTSIAIVIVLGMSSCSKNKDNSATRADQPNMVTEDMISEKGTNPDEISISESAGSINTDFDGSLSRTGKGNHHLYTESNESGQNGIIAFEVKPNGSLHLDGTTVSGGAGTGKGLGSQGAVVLDKNHEWLYAVNAGSNSVSSFKVHNDGSLTLAHTQSTGGVTPVSVSVHGNLLYVLNRGSDNIHGFRIDEGGVLTHIAGSTRSLSGTAVDAPQISFTPKGDWIVVTEKATNTVSTFRVKNDGSVSPGIFTSSTGQTPFGFAFSRDLFMIVSNAAGGAPAAGSATSYFIGNNGIPKDKNGAIPSLQAAPCWAATTKYGRFAYISNTGSNTLSSYYVAPWGGLYLVKKEAAKTDMSPADIVVADNNYYVYELNSKSGTIGGFQRKLLGGLESIGAASGISMSAAGLAIY